MKKIHEVTFMATFTNTAVKSSLKSGQYQSKSDQLHDFFKLSSRLPSRIVEWTANGEVLREL